MAVAKSEDVQSVNQTCIECKEEFASSFLFKNFGVKCCDTCRTYENSDLIPKTSAKYEYLLKDSHFDERKPRLRYISRKNPHTRSWSEMRLYLRSQVKARALEVHGSEERIDELKKQREEKQEIFKIKRYNRKQSASQKVARPTLYDITSKLDED